MPTVNNVPAPIDEEEGKPRLPANYVPVEDKDKKKSRTFDPSAAKTRLALHSLKGMDENISDLLKVFLLCSDVDETTFGREVVNKKDVYHPIGLIALYNDGSWSYLHEDEKIRRGLFTGIYEAVKRLVWSVVSGNEACPAEGRRRETDQYGHTRHRQAHPAFGMARFSRISCGGTGESMEGARLYGSQVRHGTVICLEILRGELERSLAHDWNHSGDSLIEVHMSTAQFAALVGAMNYGEGVPVTLQYVLGRRMPDLPPLPNLPELAQEDFSETMRKMLDRLSEMEAEIEANSAKLGKKKTEELKIDLGCVRETITGGLPFLRKQFYKSLCHITADAKAEMDSTAALFTQRIGEAVLDGRIPTALADGLAPPKLPEETTTFPDDLETVENEDKDE